MTLTERPTGWLYAVWYANAPGGWLLWPLEGLFRLVTGLRRWLYRTGSLRTIAVDAPVIIVGNLSVGGAGKTPLVAWLASQALKRGYRPAIVSRGYGGAEPAQPLLVTADTQVSVSGDEALMLARATPARVYVCRDRAAAAAQAVAEGADLVIGDDGLQHYRLARDAEIVVIDAERGHGNGHCLPAGPLREPPARLVDADIVVFSGNRDAARIGYRLTVSHAVNAGTGEVRALDAFDGQRIRALAGIGHPQRFYDALGDFGITVQPIPAADHQRLDEACIEPKDGLDVMMTAKDAVKYAALGAHHWVVPAELDIDAPSATALYAAIERARLRHIERTGASHA